LFALSERARLGFLCILLLIMLGTLAFAAVNTFEAVQSFQQQQRAAKAGDVSAIRPWMTIRVISHICHVPEDYLYNTLNVKDAGVLRRATLYEIANHKKQPINQVVSTVQHAILKYRKEHHFLATPTPMRRANLRPRSPTQGGEN
jgi:hypothetical protein